ncbi:MAG: class I SAM-dependent methyltransferase [Thermoplasmata archaeon]|nr:class I SAM-dependent methyltransferase [Thermoplasmata archaeon]
MVWPPPPPGRPEWAWLLRLPPRGWMQRRLLRPLTSRLDDRATVVSIGGGPGFEVRQLHRLRPPLAQWRVVLLDAQRGMLDQPQWHRPGDTANPDRVLGDAVRLPLPDASVDAVLSLGVLCCLTNDGAHAAAREAWRVVRPGGFVALSVPRWRGALDDERHTRLGFERIAGSRRGRSIFRKHK